MSFLSDFDEIENRRTYFSCNAIFTVGNVFHWGLEGPGSDTNQSPICYEMQRCQLLAHSEDLHCRKENVERLSNIKGVGNVLATFPESSLSEIKEPTMRLAVLWQFTNSQIYLFLFEEFSIFLSTATDLGLFVFF